MPGGLIPQKYVTDLYVCIFPISLEEAIDERARKEGEGGVRET